MQYGYNSTDIIYLNTCFICTIYSYKIKQKGSQKIKIKCFQVLETARGKIMYLDKHLPRQEGKCENLWT